MSELTVENDKLRAPFGRCSEQLSPDQLKSAITLGRNALIAIAMDTQITGGQFIHLDRDGHTLAKAEAHARPTAKGKPSSSCARRFHVLKTPVSFLGLELSANYGSFLEANIKDLVRWRRIQHLCCAWLPPSACGAVGG